MKKVSSKLTTCIAALSLAMIAAAGCTDKPHTATGPAPTAVPPAGIESSQRALSNDTGLKHPTVSAVSGGSNWVNTAAAIDTDTDTGTATSSYTSGSVDGSWIVYFSGFETSVLTNTNSSTTLTRYDAQLVAKRDGTGTSTGCTIEVRMQWSGGGTASGSKTVYVPDVNSAESTTILLSDTIAGWGGTAPTAANVIGDFGVRILYNSPDGQDCGALHLWDVQEKVSYDTATSNCAAGSVETGASTCSQCAAGTYAHSGDTVCSPCASGFVSLAGAADCTSCDPGTYAGTPVDDGTPIDGGTPVDGGASAAVCIACPGGQSSPGGTTFCTAVAISAISPNSGPTGGGTTVTITGWGFSDTTTVTLDGLPATAVTVSSSSTLTAVTPAHAAGSVNVVVTDGATATLTGGFTYFVPVANGPAPASLTPISGPTIGGTVVTIAGTNFGSDATVKFGTTAATSITVVSATQIKATTPAHAAGAVDLTVTNVAAAITGTLGGAFTYVAPPSISTLTPSSGPVAGGTVVTIAGANFTSGVKLLVAGTEVSITSSTATQIVFTAPAHAAGAVDIRVTNVDGQSALKTGGYTYVAPGIDGGVVGTSDGGVSDAIVTVHVDSGVVGTPDAIVILPADSGVVGTPDAIVIVPTDAAVTIGDAAIAADRPADSASVVGIDGGAKDTVVVVPVDAGTVIGSDARAADAASDATTKKPAGDSGCSCNVGSSHSQAPGGLVAFLLVGAMLLVRRSRRTK